MPLYEIEQTELLGGQSFASWASASSQSVWSRIEGAGGEVVAVWSAAFGVTPQAIALYCYPDGDALMAVRGAECVPGRTPADDRRDAVTLRRTSRILVPSPFWDVRPMPADGLFTMRIFWIDPSKTEAFQRHTAETIWPLGESHGHGRFLGLWSRVLGPPGEVVFISRYDDLAHWQGTHPNVGEEGSPEVTRWWAAMRERNDMVRTTEVIAMQPVVAA
ncbi:MAG TPA: hypothetical protein VE990_05745 [Acidimicrobiales bacterium]|nr:hypothetical protein [Acidimicrobiales bacterium]